MSDFINEVVRIQKIEKHPNADTLSVATIMDIYPVVIKTGQYQEGDLVAYINYDAIVPDNEFWHFLAPQDKKDEAGNVIKPGTPVGQVKEKDRTIRVRKIRGQYSEGLIVAAPPGFKEGDSVAEFFELKKRVYEEELPETERGNYGNENGPSGINLFKYDLDGLAKYSYAFQEGEEVIVFEKCEGQNLTFLYTQDRLFVRSRNYYKQDHPDSVLWNLGRRLNMEEKLKAYPGLAIWGECYGAVKKWFYDCPIVDGVVQCKFRVFDIYNTQTRKFMEWNEVEEICNKLKLEMVPILYRGPFKNDDAFKALAEGQSTFGTCVREGCVIRSIPEGWHHKLGRKIVKLKGKDYKLAKG